MNDKISLIGAPTDIGAGSRGSSMGPEALRVANIASCTSLFQVTTSARCR